MLLFFKKILSSQQAGFKHVHRTRGAVGPHCVFDVVIPYQDSSQKERIVGQYCTPEQATGGAAVGDYDGDGMEDIYFTVFDGRSVLYKNNGKFNRDPLSIIVLTILFVPNKPINLAQSLTGMVKLLFIFFLHYLLIN